MSPSVRSENIRARVSSLLLLLLLLTSSWFLLLQIHTVAGWFSFKHTEPPEPPPSGKSVRVPEENREENQRPPVCSKPEFR